MKILFNKIVYKIKNLRFVKIFERIFVATLFKNFARVIDNLKGISKLKRNDIDVKNFYNSNLLEFFDINLEKLDFDVEQFVNTQKESELYKSRDGKQNIRKTWNLFPVGPIYEKNKDKIDKIRYLIENDKKFQEISKNHFNNKLRLTEISVFLNYPPKELDNYDKSNSNSGNYYSEGFHSDRLTIDTSRIFISLRKIGENNGPTEFLDRETSKKIIKNTIFVYKNLSTGSIGGGRVDKEISKKDFKIHSLNGNKGTAVFWNPNLILHRGNRPKLDNERLILSAVCQIYPYTLIPSLNHKKEKSFVLPA